MLGQVLSPHADTFTPSCPSFPQHSSSFTPEQSTHGVNMMQMVTYPQLPSAVAPLIPFIPSRSRQGINAATSSETLRSVVEPKLNLNPKYKGEIDYRTVQNASCPSALNCSVHVKGFSPWESQQEMLSVAQHIRVAALNRHDPFPPRFPMAAGDFTFFDRESAVQFMQFGVRGMLSAHGYPLMFKWNKNKVCPASAEECRQSRTLLIQGPKMEISLDEIRSVLECNLTFDLVDCEEQYLGNGRTLVRLEFSQIRGQSRAAMKCIWTYTHVKEIPDAWVDYA
ncbi:hypothetical protein ONS95_001008 [Cadophora gregata]|uniref:uncharacterized protein n=1 Tax=Cadophora gregata TaxID=51156 RepID=UPI0026DACEC1|nr:uncharacterized protein ONS95_001008 [Cadophora gregata]KAK0129067.1 hypothetical protein ONS95_001008 [Cadophora gregata]